MAEMTLKLHHQNGIYVITSNDVPGLYVAHNDVDVVMRDVAPSIEKLDRLNGANGEMASAIRKTIANREETDDGDRSVDVTHVIMNGPAAVAKIFGSISMAVAMIGVSVFMAQATCKCVW